MTLARERYVVFVLPGGAAIADAEVFGVWRDHDEAAAVADRVTGETDHELAAMVMQILPSKSARAIKRAFRWAFE